MIETGICIKMVMHNTQESGLLYTFTNINKQLGLAVAGEPIAFIFVDVYCSLVETSVTCEN